jgi:hypothetical protein
MIVESGVIVFLGLLFLFAKLPRRIALWLLGRPLMLDIAVSALALLIHWGTFTGVMAAAVAGLLTSGFSSAARWLFGWIDRDGFHPGVIAIRP